MDIGKEQNSLQQFEARQYQLELLDYVTNNNGIIYLPTGAGKTYVAIMALKRFSLNMNKTIENGGKRAIFMCKTVELAYQQCSELRRHTNLKIGLYLGGRGVDNWNRERWKKEIDENQVLVGTAQIFLDIISQNVIGIRDLSIVIIDECHHGTKKDAMHEFMRTFKSEPNAKLHPRVIGLTGVLLKGNKLNNIMESLRNLEITYHSTIVTVSSTEEFINVLIHSTNPEEQWLLYTPNTNLPSINESINLQIRKCLEIVSIFDIGNHPAKFTKGLIQQREPNKKRTIIRLLNDFQYHLQEYGLYCSHFLLQSAIIELEIKMRQAETIALRRMYRISITSLEAIHHMIYGKFREFLKQQNLSTDNCHQLNVIWEFSTPRVVQLLKGIEDNFSSKISSQISCLVFVERRLTAKSMCSVIKNFAQLTPSLKEKIFPDFMVGRDSMHASAVENILERKWNKKVMSEFRENTKNMIICSNVLEEGIDIQACNFVIVFDPLKTFNSYIQTKGRARSTGSKYVITASTLEESKVAEQIKNYQIIYDTVQKFLIERILEPTHPNQFEIDREFTDKIPTLTTPNGACLLASSALTTLYRYCQMLPWDLFTGVMAQFKKVESNELGVVVSVKLPLQSRVRDEIFSDRMENVKLAKVSAAMKACRRLYEEGELNENLLPITKQDCVKSLSHTLFKHWEKYEKEATNKEKKKAKKRLYEKCCPAELYDALPIVGETCYAYKITLATEFECNDYNQHVIESLSTKSKFALLLRNRLPRLAPMPLFMRQGPLKACISSIPIEVVIESDVQLSRLRKHHVMIMRDILAECWQNYYVQDMRNKQYSYLIVPLNDDEINWQLVEQFEQLKPICKLTVEERQHRSYNEEHWLGKIVSRWYGNEKDRLLVTKVHTDQTPLTAFPDDNSLKYKSYLDYFESRYGEKIERVVDRTQFLIEIKPLTGRRNFFNNAKDKQKVIQREAQKMLLIPELCHNFDYPGDLWLQAIFLPSVLHRLNFLLHAEHLRMCFNSYLGVNNPNDYQPKPVIIDVSLRRAVDVDGNACAPSEKTPPILLPSLPTSSIEDISLIDDHSTKTVKRQFWKSFEEPLNFSRKSSNIYPVELQYYCNFDQKWKHDKNLCEVQFTKDQLQRDVPTYSITEPTTTTLAIEQTSLDERRRIMILERGSGTLQQKYTAEQYEFLSALTTSSSNDVFDMERLELLGDSFLKFSISLYLANKFPSWNEGFLTEVKSKLVSNKNLLYCLLETDIPNRICSNMLTMHEWLPPLISLPANFLELIERNPEIHSSISFNHLREIVLNQEEILTGRCNDEHLKQFINSCKKNNDAADDCNDLNFCVYKDLRADKIVADTLEALLGVCVKNYGIQSSFRMLEFFGLCHPDDDRPLSNLLELELGGSQLRTKRDPQEIDAFLINVESLERNLGYKFSDRAYLLQALTHPSFPTNRLTGCYQELEFIGDAILDMLITCYIFERNQTLTPGMLTDLRSALVNNITLGCISVRNRFHLFLLAENVVLAEMIKNFVEYQETQGHRVTDQVYILMEEQEAVLDADPSNRKFNIAQNVEVPKVLGDIVEALIAAVYLDSRCLHTTWNVIYRLFEFELNEFSHKVPIDPVRRLIEHPTARPKFSDPDTNKNITTVKCVFRCMEKIIPVNGFGANKWQAKKAAAKQALKLLDKE